MSFFVTGPQTTTDKTDLLAITAEEEGPVDEKHFYEQ